MGDDQLAWYVAIGGGLFALLFIFSLAVTVSEFY
jgi:hypothetical protein